MDYFTFGYSVASGFDAECHRTLIPGVATSENAINQPNLSNLNIIMENRHKPLKVDIDCKHCGVATTKKLYIVQVGKNEEMYLSEKIWVERNIGQLAKNIDGSPIPNTLFEYKSLLVVYSEIMDLLPDEFKVFRTIYCYALGGIVLTAYSANINYV